MINDLQNEIILITGGSGFIGTNLLDSLLKYGCTLFNIDINKPLQKRHFNLWHKIDILNFNLLETFILSKRPSIIIHLAAVTDLNGKNLKYYDANITGVENIIKIANNIEEVKKVIFTSSMYVCKPGYVPMDFNDYKPHTCYGESKMLGEKIIKENNPQKYTWCIIRPTSIWGPWFKEPYADFFKIILGHKYLHFGSKVCKKTYGYVENTIYQIECLLDSNKELIHGKTFYIGDWPAYDISEWANEIASYNHIKIHRVPFPVFRLLATCGDILKYIGVRFPMTSFRLKNMTTDNIHDLSLIKDIAPDLPVSRLDGVKRTVDWLILRK